MKDNSVHPHSQRESAYAFLLTEVRTIDQAAELKERLEKVSAQLYHVNVNIESVFKKTFPLGVWQGFEDYFKQEKISLKDSKQFQIFLADLSEWVSKLPVLKLEVAFEITPHSLEKIYGWLEQSYPGVKVLLDFRINPSLIGGSVVCFAGKIGDYSLKRRVGEV